MHYYQFNISGYQNHTKHLIPIKDICYRRLLDGQYRHEIPIPIDAKALYRLIMLRDYVEHVQQILNEFFEFTNDDWINQRAYKEIKKYLPVKKNHWSLKLTKSQRCSIQAIRNATKINASLYWLTKDHKFQIAEFYFKTDIQTSETGIAHEFDYIIPLRGKVVCGLHVHWNLQVLSASKNRQKSSLLGIS
ncbi:YdaU family protein [Nitrosomonas supralitoralis]|uniref:Uncharacterized protein n=1 Tax=Nitrosomonas supralitoralis TaxID=2116706 RepID=A0A2P7NSA2_9PROT|nr:YdaU family protein [Nitrosomonas supralitoralis]PSJ16353.1 hypothetical protein C7H79_13930 [Nitrosomonas supralitoralis]